MFGYTYTLHDQFFNQLRRKMFDIFEENGSSHLSTWPPANLYDSGDALILELEVPGITEEELQITLTQEVLTLSGERKSTLPSEVHLHRRERPASKFSRSFTLPYRVDPKAVKATLTDGILEVVLPKHPEEKPHTITIGQGGK